MILHNAGKYNGDEKTLPEREHPANAVPFKEPESMEKLAIIANVGAVVLMIVLAIPLILLGKQYFFTNSRALLIGSVGSLLTFLPHELLHAICFKGDVYFYNNIRQGLLFVVGTEDMSKTRFIFMSLLPNLVFGVIPYIVFLLNPKCLILGVLGTLCVGMGFGDYINVFNALTQVPKGAVTYLSGMHSFWYFPETKKS